MLRAIGRFLLFVLIALGVAEGALRLASGLLARDPAEELLPTTNQTVVLCVGDSHTWGMGHGYPEGLAVRLSERAPSYRVVNLGVPGSNTAQLRKRLAADLERFQPRLVVLWSGVNNSWNRTDTDVWTDSGVAPISWPRRLVEWSRLWRLVLTWRHYARLHEVLQTSGALVAPAMHRDPSDPGQTYRRDLLGDEDVQHHEAADLLSDDDLARVTETDVRWIAAQCAARDIPLIAITYPLPGGAFIPTNRGIEVAARVANVPLVDPAVAQERLIARYGGREHLPPTFDASVHPTQLLYDEVAAMVLEVSDRLGALGPRGEPQQ